MLNEYYKLITNTQQKLNAYIPIDAEWYVVNMLCTRQDLEEFPMLSYAQLGASSDIIYDLRRLGDSGLIMPSLFPDRCKKLNISKDWYYGVSYSCFSELYQRLSENVYECILENFHTIKLILCNILTKPKDMV